MRTKLFFFSILCILPFSFQIQAKKERESQTFMWTRQAYRNIGAQQFIWHNYLNDQGLCCDPMLSSVQVLGIYQQSTSTDAQARYFLFNNKNTLIVKGDHGVNSFDRDIRAEWLNLPRAFAGTFSLNPQQKQAAVWFEFKQDLKKCFNNSFFDPLWIDISMPVQMIENNIGLEDMTTTTVDLSMARFKSIEEAFVQCDWKYAKIRKGNHRKTTVAELMFKLGASFLHEDGFEVDYYGLFVFPTHGAVSPEFLFDPFIGNNRHFGFGTGVLFQLPITRSHICCGFPAFFFMIENIMFLRNEQKRTLDLKNKPWSRYLLLANKKDPLLKKVPAMNVTTVKVKAEPFNFVDLSTGLRWVSDVFEAEMGFDLWAHGNQELKLRKPFTEDFGIAGTGTTMVKGLTVCATASESTIACLAPNDAEFTPIRERDLDLLSGAARSAVTYRVHIAAGTKVEGCTLDGFFGGGGHYEVSQDNSVLRNWQVWAKMGFNF